MEVEIILKLFKYNNFIICDCFIFIVSVILYLVFCVNFMMEVVKYGKVDV